MKRIYLKIKRQDAPEGVPYWEHFQSARRPGLTVIGLLRDIRLSPRNAKGEAVAPVAWESNCEEGACGSCAMRINGRPAMACHTRVGDTRHPVVLEPMGGFPVLRDLVVDRERLFDTFRRANDWIETGRSTLDELPDVGRQPVSSLVRSLSSCIACGLCLSVCPQSHPSERSNERTIERENGFIGPAVLARLLQFNLISSDESVREKRFSLLTGPGGLEECGHAQNCQSACPSDVPLLTSIALLNREASKRLLR